MKWVFSSLTFMLCAFTFGQNLQSGLWKGVIHYSQQEVPFTFEVSNTRNSTSIVLINGLERREIQNVTVLDDSIKMTLSPFDVEIRAAFNQESMEGSYIRNYRGEKARFTASFGDERFTRDVGDSSNDMDLRWEMTFERGAPNESKGLGLFEKIGEKVYGTVMTRTSDFRYFEGILDGDSIKMSSFDGAHAFMILGRKNEEMWQGEFVFDDGYSEAWEGVPNSDFELEDPFQIVQLESGSYRPYYDLLGAGSGKNSIEVGKYENKALIIQLFGTWCPNSFDQTNYLVEWYNSKKPENVEILASSYEANYSMEYGLKRIDEYIDDNEIPYEVVLGGRLSKSSAAMPFSFIDRIEAFPTLVFVDKQGYVRYVHSYFNGPATGSYYDEFDQRFGEIITELSGE